jgi:hypothetical protein
MMKRPEDPARKGDQNFAQILFGKKTRSVLLGDLSEVGRLMLGRVSK